MVEETPAGWTDEGLAFSLDNMMKRMHKYLTREKLPHYMIYKRNTFDGLPKHKIRTAQEKFHRLQENLGWHSNISTLQFEWYLSLRNRWKSN